MYQFAKDFASPIATFIATMTAAAITFTFVRVQARIAASRRDIALDKLKFDYSATDMRFTKRQRSFWNMCHSLMISKSQTHRKFVRFL
jgi:hypothetical protein